MSAPRTDKAGWKQRVQHHLDKWQGKPEPEKKRFKLVPANDSAPPDLPPAQKIPLPSSITGPLKGVIAKYRTVSLLEGISRCLVLGVGMMLLQALGDWWLNFAWPVRFIFLLLDIGIVGWTFNKYVLKPMKRPLDLTDAALMTERKVKGWKSSLVSVVQLCQANPGTVQGSVDLVQQLLVQVQTRLRTHPIKGVISGKTMQRWLGGAMAVVLLAAGLTAYGYPGSMQLIKRLALFPVQLPTKTLVVAETEDINMALGSDVELAALAQGVIPKNGRVDLKYADGRNNSVPLRPSAADKDRFAVTLRNVQGAFTYKFSLNDGEGARYQVNVETPPSIQDIEFLQKYPEYVGLEPVKRTSANLSLLAGSRLEIKLKATQPLEAAVIHLQGGEDAQTIDMEVKGGDEVTVEVPIPAENMDGFTISLTNKKGVTSNRDILYSVQIVPDEVPTVTWGGLSVPTGSLTLRAKPRLQATAEDDQALSGLALVYEIYGEGVDMRPGRIALPKPDGVNRTAVDYNWDLTSMQPSPGLGDTVSYWIEASDNNNITGPGVGKSEVFEFMLVTPERKQQEILDRLIEKAQTIRQIGSQQEKASDDVKTLIRQ